LLTGRVRLYGEKPYGVAVLHGGPGAMGSVEDVARHLAKWEWGAMEPWQSRLTVMGQVEELHEQLKAYGRLPVVVIGHSWGAWLALLHNAAHPETVKKLILVDSGPLESRYVPEIMERRKANLGLEAGKVFLRLLGEAERGDAKAMAQLGELAGQADSVDPLLQGTNEPDAEQYKQVWPEADAMRRQGKLKEALSGIDCPVTVIHGAQDPHPPAGVLEPLKEMGVPCRSFILPKCGHTPWLERGAREAFYKLLNEELRDWKK
jgi:pimeloyl-ACP methyl ester carboxylesterase